MKMKLFAVLVLGLLVAAASQATVYVWTGAADSDFFNESNWVEEGTTTNPPADTMNPEVDINHDLVIASGTAAVDAASFASEPYLGPGVGSLTMTGGILDFIGSAGNNGLAASVDGTDLDNCAFSMSSDSLAQLQYILDLDVVLSGTATLELYGGGNPINRTVIDLQSDGASIHCTAETPAAFQTEHLSKILVLGNPAVVGTDLAVLEPGDNLLVVSDGASGCIASGNPVEFKKAVLTAPAYDAPATDVLPTLEWSAGVAIVGTPKYRVYLGTTEPNDLFADYGLTELTGGSPEEITSITPPAALPNDTLHWWVVDTYEPNSLGEPPAYQPVRYPGASWKFTTIPAFPFIDNGPQDVYVYADRGETAEFTIEFSSLSAITASSWERFDNDGNDWVDAGAGVVDEGSTPKAATLTIADVTAANAGLYRCTLTNAGGPTTSDAAELYIKGLVGHWPFDGSGEDIVGENDAATAANAVYTEGIIGVDPNCINFVEGAAPATISMAPYTSSSWTLSWWDYSEGQEADNDTNWGMILSAGDGDVDDGNGWEIFEMGRESADWYVVGYNIGGGYLWTPTTYPREAWHCHVVTYDGSDNTSSWYIDGIKVRDFTGVNFTAWSEYLYVGNVEILTEPFLGRLDDLKLYNYPLTDTEVSDVYAAVVGTYCKASPAYDFDDDCIQDMRDFAVLAAAWQTDGYYAGSTALSDPNIHWKLDDGSGTTAGDATGYGNDGTLAGDPAWVTGIDGGALEFDGDGDHVKRTLTESVWEAYSVSLWVKAGALGQAAYSGIFNNAGAGNDFQIDVGNDYYRYNGDSAAQRQITPVSTTEWTHLVVTCDGVGTSVYADGEYVTTYAGAADNQFGQIQIGVNRGQNLFFNGTIDDVRIYDVVLTPEEIAELYVAFKPGSLVCYNPTFSVCDIAGGEPDGEGNPTPDCEITMADFAEFIVTDWLYNGLYPAP